MQAHASKPVRLAHFDLPPAGRKQSTHDHNDAMPTYPLEPKFALEKHSRGTAHLRMEDARRLRASAFSALASETRLARMAAYSFCGKLEFGMLGKGGGYVQQHPWSSRRCGASGPDGGACAGGAGE